MSKRQVNRIGDIYCVEIDNEYKCYFQYVAKDATMLGGKVIRVFKTHYSMDYVPNMDEIVKDDIFYYTHTMVKIGVELGAWYKVGSHRDKGETENIMFKLYNEVAPLPDKSSRWDVWKINEPMRRIGEMTDECRGYYMGWLYSYLDVLSMIRDGRHRHKDIQ